jgi:hypothetical protein
LFNENKRVVGTLTGGSSSCSATTLEDYYGKMSFSWNSNGASAEFQLGPWLDPSGDHSQKSIDGREANCVNPGKEEAIGKESIHHFFPNPAANQITFHHTMDQVTLFNLEGKQLHEWYAVRSIEFPDLKKGSYIVKTRKGDRIHSQLLLKE